MAHPVRPESYISMDNFYTGTVYVKGAEVVRMYRTLLGEAGFKKGMVLYFERHDGGAVTCDDFRAAMADANNVDLSQFERWYNQAGTPVVEATQSYDEKAQTLTLSFKQYTPTTPGQLQESKLPLLIPIEIGLLSASSGVEIHPSTVLQLTQSEQSFVIKDVKEKPITSMLRGFSAPVKMKFEQSDEELAFIMAHDTDSFNKWDAGNRLGSALILKLAALPTVADIEATSVPSYYVDAIRTVLTSCTSTGKRIQINTYVFSWIHNT